MKPFDNRRLTKVFMTEVVAFIRKNHQQPFFLYLPFTAPHFPVEAHPNWKGKSANAEYGDAVEEMDARIGEMMNTLKDLGIANNTLVVFTSDNRPQPNCKQPPIPTGTKSGPRSKAQRACHPSCIGPMQILAGSTYQNLAAAINILPTLAEACVLDTKAPQSAPPLDGISL